MSKERWHYLGTLLVLAAVYFLSGRLGLSIPSQDMHITLFWLPSGIAVVALFLFGTKCWPGIVLGALGIVLSLGNGLGFAVLIAIGNTLAPIITVWLLRRWQFNHYFGSRRDLYLLVSAAAIGMLLSSAGGTAVLWGREMIPTSEILPAWLHWWMGDFLGVLLVGPILLALTHKSRSNIMCRPVEAALSALMLAVVGGLIFCSSIIEYAMALSFLPLPILLSVSMRLGFSASALAVLELSLLTAIGTGLGQGAFGSLPAEVGYVIAWFYILCIVLIGLKTTTMLGERLAVEKKLRKSEASLRASNDIASLGSFELDITSGHWVSTSNLERIFGLPPSSVHVLEEWANLIHPEDRLGTIEYMKHEVIGQGKKFDREYRIIRHHDQIERWMHGLGQVERDSEGQVVKIHGTIQDVTERKRAEQLLARSMQQLEEKELAKSRFLAAAGHDLRQPLAAANIFINTLMFSNPSREQKEIIQNLEQVMQNFHQLLDSLLNISKLDAGVIKPEYILIDVVDIFKRIEQNFSPIAVEKGLRFSFYFPMNQTLTIQTDMSLICSVLMNLVSNAIKHTSRGGVLISARVRGGDVLFQVWDTGIGIMQKDIGKIYDEFFQVNNPQRDSSIGLGLGLSIAKRALALLGGEFECRSRPGHGAVFGFRLPLHQGQQGLQQPVSHSSHIGHDSQMAFVEGKRFMVVEDDAMVGKAICAALAMMHGESICFSSAEGALLHTTEKTVDYYIVDYMLSGKMNGIALLNQLRQLQGRPIHAVLITGDTSPEFVRSMTSCKWPIRHKPVTISELISSLGSPAR